MKLYFINDDVYPNSIYGDQRPHCITLQEINRLALEWDDPYLIDQFHEATADEIAEFGTEENAQ